MIKYSYSSTVLKFAILVLYSISIFCCFYSSTSLQFKREILLFTSLHLFANFSYYSYFADLYFDNAKHNQQISDDDVL